MASVNKVILIGNVGGAPEIRYMPNGEAVANFSIATTDQWKDKGGQKQERTTWHRIAAYRKLSEIVESYVTKGTSIYIEGRIDSKKFTDKDGIEKFSFQIIAEHLLLLGSKEARPAQEKNKSNGYQSQPDDNTDFEDDIPF